MTTYPSHIAQEVATRRPDLCGSDAIAAVLMSDPSLSADEVIEILDEATAEHAAEMVHERAALGANVLATATAARDASAAADAAENLPGHTCQGRGFPMFDALCPGCESAADAAQQLDNHEPGMRAGYAKPATRRAQRAPVLVELSAQLLATDTAVGLELRFKLENGAVGWLTLPRESVRRLAALLARAGPRRHRPCPRAQRSDRERRRLQAPRADARYPRSGTPDRSLHASPGRPRLSRKGRLRADQARALAGVLRSDHGRAVTVPSIKKCHRCKRAPWTCGGCGAKCCEHLCGGKANDGRATCGNCSRGKGWSRAKPAPLLHNSGPLKTS